MRAELCRHGVNYEHSTYRSKIDKQITTQKATVVSRTRQLWHCGGYMYGPMGYSYEEGTSIASEVEWMLGQASGNPI